MKLVKREGQHHIRIYGQFPNLLRSAGLNRIITKSASYQTFNNSLNEDQITYNIKHLGH